MPEGNFLVKPTLVRRLVLSAATVGAVWLTVAVGFDLAGYGVPLPFLGALCLACLVVFLNAGARPTSPGRRPPTAAPPARSRSG